MERGIRDWIAHTREVYDRRGVTGIAEGLYYAYVGLWLTASTRLTPGRDPFEHDWDLLVVLDACRVDALEAVADEYDCIEDVDSAVSVGSTSGEWVAHTFDERHREQIEQTAYVSANPHTDAVLRNRNVPPQYVPAPVTAPDWNPVGPDAFAELVEVWQTDFADRLGVTPPRATTDRAIEVGRNSDVDRQIVHYMQPHAPYVHDCVDEGSPPAKFADPFSHLRSGELDREEAWEAYLETLRLVLDEVALLCENVDAENVVITADHGEAFGELHFYEHPVGCPHPAVKTVPWVETTATDAGTHEPATTGTEESGTTGTEESGTTGTEESAAAADAQAGEVSVEEQLVALGYQ